MSFINAVRNFNTEIWDLESHALGKNQAIGRRVAYSLLAVQTICIVGLVIAAAVTQNTKINLALKIMAGTTIATSVGTFGNDFFIISRMKGKNLSKLNSILAKHIGEKGDNCVSSIFAKYFIEIFALTGLLIAASVTKSTKVNLAFKVVAGITAGTFLLTIIAQGGFLLHRSKKKAIEHAEEELAIVK